jgi:TPR repeat protein
VADGPTAFNVGQGGDPYDQLLAQVREAATGVYDVLGEMGRSKSGNVVYLARELESGHLVAMKLSRTVGASEGEFNHEVVKTLDGSMPGLENKCPECKALLPDWDRFCFRCGADLSGSGATPGAAESNQLLEAVKEATAGEYDILGKMDRTDGRGVVFFARDLKRGKLVALRLKQDQSADPNQAAYSIGETQVFRPLAAELGATQVASAYSAPPPVLPKAEPVPAPRIEPPLAPPPAVPPPSGGRVPASGKKPPVKAIAGIGGALLVVLIGYFAFRNPNPSPPPAVVQTPPPAPPPPPSVDTTTTASAPSPAPPPAATSAADSATLVVASKLPTGAKLTIDGRAVRGTSVRVGPGAHAMAVAAAGFEPLTTRIVVKAGEVNRWRPVLVPVKTVAQTPPPPPPPPPPPAAAPLNCARAVAKTEWPQAVELCAKEAAAGDIAAARHYAIILDEGHGVAADPAKAVTWYSKAAASGDHESQLRLGYMYRSGSGVKRDDKQAALLFKLAAEGGLGAAAMEYGVALEDGKGVDRNEQQAAEWYQKASAAGSDRATWRLGLLYQRGKGVAKNEAEAANLFRQAADRGERDAAYSLGKMYKDGKGVEKSVEKAIEYFRKAAQAGQKQAADELKDLEKK